MRLTGNLLLWLLKRRFRGVATATVLGWVLKFLVWRYVVETRVVNLALLSASWVGHGTRASESQEKGRLVVPSGAETVGLAYEDDGERRRVLIVLGRCFLGSPIVPLSTRYLVKYFQVTRLLL